MDKSYFIGNRKRFAADMKPGSIAIMFSGQEIRKTHDEHEYDADDFYCRWCGTGWSG